VAKYQIIVPAAAGTAPHYAIEQEALADVDAEFVHGPTDEAGFAEAAKNADAVYANSIFISKRIIDGLEKCRIIVGGGVGMDGIDVPAATARGIPVTNVPDTFVEEVADHTMALLLAGFRRVIEQDRMVREGRWREGRPALLQIPRLMGQTLGFIAFGHIPRAVAVRARAFGLHMLAYDPYVEELVMPPYGVLPATLEEVLRQSDFVAMHVPGTVIGAKGMLGEEHFRMMKPGAVFINTGRGSTVQEAALIRALQEGWIAHAALDVLEQEPPGHNNPLLSMSNVTLSAHVASASARFDPARKRRVGQNLALALTGRWPMSCVNPSVLEKGPLRRWQPYSMERGPNS
jgi:D-3-phosphoglycerate dehydrogenase